MRSIPFDLSRPAQFDSPAGRVLAIDYGRKRIGLAISDELRATAQPLQILQRENRRSDFHRLREIVRDRDIKLIILGHPVRLSGEESEMSEEVSRFAVKLRRELKLEVMLVDERLTSWEAEQLPTSRRRSAARTRVDDLAAAVLLREYLDGCKQVSSQLPAEIAR
jgi:putative holliday junction resolvase